jgi:hypothetical protein
MFLYFRLGYFSSGLYKLVLDRSGLFRFSQDTLG